MVTVIAASLSGIFGVVAVLAGIRLSQRGDETHRRQDHEHDHRERLQVARLDAYREFTSTFAQNQRVYSTLESAFIGRQIWAKKIPGASASELAHITVMFDNANRVWTDALLEAVSAAELLEDALASLELVASSKVLASAVQLRDCAQAAWLTRRRMGEELMNADPGPALLEPVQASQLALEVAREALREEIRSELGLETG